MDNFESETKPKTGKLILIVGKSGGGKTKLAKNMIAYHAHITDGKPMVYENDGPEYIEKIKEITTNRESKMFFEPKYVTRAKRVDDVDVIPTNADYIYSNCDCVIKGYKEDDIVGLNISEIIKEIDEGKCPVIVTGFIELLQEILKRFMQLDRLDDICIVGLHSYTYTTDELIKLQQERLGTSTLTPEIRDSSERRANKARTMDTFLSDYEGIFDVLIRNYFSHDLTSTNAKNIDIVQEAIKLSQTYVKHSKKSLVQRILIQEFIKINISKIDPSLSTNQDLGFEFK